MSRGKKRQLIQGQPSWSLSCCWASAMRRAWDTGGMNAGVVKPEAWVRYSNIVCNCNNNNNNNNHNNNSPTQMFGPFSESRFPLLDLTTKVEKLSPVTKQLLMIDLPFMDHGFPHPRCNHPAGSRNNPPPMAPAAFGKSSKMGSWVKDTPKWKESTLHLQPPQKNLAISFLLDQVFSFLNLPNTKKHHLLNSIERWYGTCKKNGGVGEIIDIVKCSKSRTGVHFHL